MPYDKRLLKFVFFEYNNCSVLANARSNKIWPFNSDRYLNAVVGI